MYFLLKELKKTCQFDGIFLIKIASTQKKAHADGVLHGLIF